jgi:hypothetical protein
LQDVLEKIDSSEKELETIHKKIKAANEEYAQFLRDKKTQDAVKKLF